VPVYRRIIWLAAITACGVFLIAAVLSPWWTLSYGDWNTWFCIGPGSLMIVFDDPAFPSGPLELWVERVDPEQYSWRWRLGMEFPDVSWGNRGRFARCPLWLLALLFGAAAWSLRPRHPKLGCCRECGYDLRGNVSGRCPECGTPTGGYTEDGKLSSITGRRAVETHEKGA